jgi:hypothetical protein
LRKTLYALITTIGVVALFGTRLLCYRFGYHAAMSLPEEYLISQVMVIFGLFWLTVVLFLWSLQKGAIWDKVATAALLVLLGFTSYRVFLGNSFSLGDNRAFLEGVRDRLEQGVDPKELQNWALGVMPDTPAKEGLPIHLPNGQTVNPERSPYGASTIWKDGSFSLSPSYLPTNMQPFFPAAPVVFVRYDPNPSKKHVLVGYYGQSLGWFIASGSTHYIIDEGMNNLQWSDGLYICIQAAR